MTKNEALRHAAAAYTLALSSLEPRERFEFDRDFRLFMEFYFTGASPEFRGHLLRDLNGQVGDTAAGVFALAVADHGMRQQPNGQNDATA